MKFTLVSAILAAVTSLASASIQAADGQLNITSPLDNGQYVAGQILPIIYTPAGNPSNLLLNVYLASVGGIYPETPVDLNANVYTNDANSAPVVVDGIVYRQHSYNYPLPSTVPSGSYNVVFQNTQTNTNTSVPITINPHVETSSSAMTASVVQTAAPESASPMPTSIASNSTA